MLEEDFDYMLEKGDDGCHSSRDDDLASRESCCICLHEFDRDPKIRCAECTGIVVCVQCFSLGLETRSHKCYHNYSVDRRHIPIDSNSDWTPLEDATLLQSLIECGYGNEVDIGKKFRHRTYQEVNSRINEILELDKVQLQGIYQTSNQPLIKYQWDVLSDEPPRYQSSAQAKQVAGYWASRGEFSVPYLNNAEELLNNIKNSNEYEADDVESHDALSYALTLHYNIKLNERDRRKQCVKKHGLLLRRTHAQFAASNHRLMVFMQLLEYDELDLLTTGLDMEVSLLAKLRKLMHYRDLGMKRHRDVQLYQRLLAMRTDGKRDMASIKQLPQSALPQSLMKKKQAPSLDVSFFSGYELLTADEKKLCANVRVMPEIYLKFKQNMISLNAAEGSVLLKTARKSLNVDVNKTRKLYDFLCNEGIINRPDALKS